MNTKGTAELLPLTSLRFFLATWVVIFHLYVILKGEKDINANSISPLLNFVYCAYVAVGAFFVLSGFILTLNYRPIGHWGKSVCKKFAVARISRIYPVYLLGLVAVSPIVIGGPILSHSWGLFFRHAGSGVLNILMLQAWLPQTVLSWNGPAWSISTEAFFYLVFPFLGRFFFAVTTIRRAVLMFFGLWIIELFPAVIAVVEKVPGFGDLVAIQQPNSTMVAPFICFNPLLNLPLFLSGIVLCRCFLILRKLQTFDGKGYVFYTPALLILAVVCAIGNHIPYPLMHCGLLLPAMLALVLGLALGDRYLCTLLSWRWLVFMGKASYAEYLIHFPVRAAFEWAGVTWTNANQLTYLLATGAISALVYAFYEDPLQNTLRRLMLGRSSELKQLSARPGP